MEKTTRNIDALFAEAGDYIENKTELVKLKLADKTSEVISTTAAGLVIGVFSFFFFILLSIGIALWLGELTGKDYYGFFILGGIYALIAFIIYKLRENWIKVPVSNIILKKIFK